MTYTTDSFGNTYWGLFDGSIVDLPHIRSSAVQGVINDDTGAGFRTAGHNILVDNSSGGGGYPRIWYTPDHPNEPFTTDLLTQSGIVSLSSLYQYSRLHTTKGVTSAYAGPFTNTSLTEPGIYTIGANSSGWMIDFNSAATNATTFGVVGNGMMAFFRATYLAGTRLSNIQGFVQGYVSDPLFNSPGVYDFANIASIRISANAVDQLDNRTYRPTISGSTTQQTLLRNPTFTLTCKTGSVAGTLQATNFPCVDTTAAPNDYCIGTMPNFLIVKSGTPILGALYTVTGVGEGEANTNINTEQTTFLCCSSNPYTLIRVASVNFV